MKQRRKTWDTWVFLVWHAWGLCVGVESLVRGRTSGGELPRPILFGWVVVTSRPLLIANGVFNIVWVSCILFALWSPRRWGWWLVLLSIATSVMCILPCYIVPPLNADAPTFAGLPLAIHIILGVGMCCMLTFYVYWLAKHRREYLGLSQVRGASEVDDVKDAEGEG